MRNMSSRASLFPQVVLALQYIDAVIQGELVSA